MKAMKAMDVMDAMDAMDDSKVFGSERADGLSLRVNKGVMGQRGVSVYVQRHHRQRGADGGVVSFEQHLSFRSFEEVALWVGCDPLKSQHSSTFESALNACADIFSEATRHDKTSH